MIRILLAEDEKITALDLKIGLKELGFNVIKIVDKGFDLIEEAFNSDPDVIVSDVRLKDDINGIEAVSEILAWRKIPVIIITGFNDENTKTAIKNLKLCAFIRKPCTAKELKTVINNCLSN